jgi:hypothetical protein
MDFSHLDRLSPMLMLNADIREGREFKQQWAFVQAAFETAHKQWAIPTANMYAVVTKYSREQFHEYDRILSSWDADEADTGAD